MKVSTVRTYARCFMPPPVEGMRGHIAFRRDVTSVRPYVTVITSRNLDTFYARKLKFGIPSYTDLNLLC